MARIAGVDLPRQKHINIALTYIYGIGHPRASRLCDEAKPGQILISPRVLTKVENAVKVEAVGEFELKGIRRPLAAYNVTATAS